MDGGEAARVGGGLEVRGEVCLRIVLWRGWDLMRAGCMSEGLGILLGVN